jgi:hypothetical protein
MPPCDQSHFHQHAESLESRLNQYDELMENIRDSMDKMEGKPKKLDRFYYNKNFRYIVPTA